MAESRTTTLKDVAARAGVSIMTVSAVVNGKSAESRISEPTRRRVEEVARMMNYRPNALARSLRTRRSNVIGFYSSYPYMSVEQPFMRHVFGGLMDGCNAIERELLIFQQRSEQHGEQLYARMVDRRVDGIIVFAGQRDPVAELLRQRDLPVISIESVLEPLPAVTVEDEDGMAQLTTYLNKRNHQHIAYYCPSHQVSSNVRRARGIHNTVNELNMKLDIVAEPDLFSAWATGHWQRALDDWLDEWEQRDVHLRPTAVICWCDDRAAYLIQSCRNRGIDVPGQLAVAGFDGFAPAENQMPMTAVRAPWKQVAHTAVTLVEALCNGEHVPTETRLPVELVAGYSA